MSSKKKNKILIRPFTYIFDSVGIEATKIFCLLVLQIIMLALTRSWSAIFNILAACLGSIGAYIVNQKFNKYDIQDYFSHLLCVVQGMIAGMLIPDTFNPVTVFFITLVVMLVVKHFFGGFSYAWSNPAIFTVIVLWIVGYKLFPEFKVSFDLLAMRNPSQTLIENGVFPVYKYDSSLTDFLNGTVFNLFKVSIPEGYISMFWDTKSVIPAFRFNFITLFSSIVLFYNDPRKLIIPGFFTGVYLLFVRLLGPVFCHGIMYQGDMLLALLTSGTIFTGVFVLGWYGTTPISITGKIFYGIISGIVAFFVTGCGTSPCGMVFTVLIANIISIIIQQYENRRDRLNLNKMLNESKKNGSVNNG